MLCSLCKIIDDETELNFRVCVITQPREGKDVRELTVSADEIVEVSCTQRRLNADNCDCNCTFM